MAERTVRVLLGEVFRFGLVGVANTAVYYGCYLLLLQVSPYWVAHLIACPISVVFSFFMNSWFTYRVRPTLRRLLAFPLSVVANLGFTTFGTVLLVEAAHVDERWAPLFAGVLALPITFMITRLVLTQESFTGERTA